MQFHLLIDGRMVDGARRQDIVNPADATLLTDSPCADRAQVDQAVTAARRAFPGWRDLPVDDRAACLHALAAAMEEGADALARLLTREQGKPLAEARGEVEGAIAAIRYYADLRAQPHSFRDSATEQVIEQRYPLGVVAAIMPWNYPLLLLALKLAPALMAGNCVIAKPAPTTPLTTLMLGAIAAPLFPPGVIQTLGDDGHVGPMLTAHPGIAHISFTGSTATGRAVMASAAATVKRVTLELGGNDAALLLDDADIDAIAPDLFAGAMSNAGQICLGIKRIYAPRAKVDRLCDALVALAQQVMPGDGLDPATTMGPVQNIAQHARLAALLADSRARGRIVHGGDRIDRPGYFIAPTLVRDLPDDAPLVTQEQFGPVLPILAYDDEADAIARINDSIYGLAASVWSADPARGLAMAGRIDSGVVWVNRIFDLPFDVPIGGARQSGIGRHQGLAGLEEYMQVRIVNAALA